MTQEELGNAVGYDRSTISRIENGKKRQDPVLLKEIADVLDARKEYFLEGEANMAKDEKEPSLEEKAMWYDNLSELLGMGFDLDRNSARDLIASTNELIRLKSEENLS